MMSLVDFSNLSPEHRHLLQLAKEQQGLDVVPLQELKGGQTGASLYLASISSGDSRQVTHYVIKFDRVNEKARPTETERHHLAVRQAPDPFGRENMPRLAYAFEHEGATALFYTLAGQSLQRFRTLASTPSQNRLAALFAATNEFLLRGWNAGANFERAVPPQKLLQTWLGYRLKPDGLIAAFLRERFALDPQVEGFLVQGQVYPNPLRYGLDAGCWKESRAIDVLTGYQHGDLNTGNILAKFADDSETLAGFFLIDFALYKAEMPLLYDQAYLEISYLVRELERTGLQKWVSFVEHFSDRDLPDPREVPVEFAGTSAVISGGRSSFERWVQETHPSLSDDLWGQFWLAAVAAGLNFCNKAALPSESRLAGLIYSAVHLKRYCRQFGIPLPVDVRLLYDASAWESSGSTRTLGPLPERRQVNLPVQPTPFIGRKSEMAAVRDLLTRNGQGQELHLVTLTGPGGTGKTRLALEVAASLLDQFPDGVHFVDLAPIREPDSVLPAIARSVGLRETGDQPLLEALTGQLRTQKTLLLLDNFEQVTAAAPRLADLLLACPGLKLLVTSRESLHLRGEQLYPVLPLRLPQAGPKQPSPEQLTQYEAVQLFIERVLAVKPGFTVTNENAPAVAEICHRLDGLPLAIELAAARIKLFSPQALLERLGSRLGMLKGGARDLPLRQQTLRGTIHWSYELLDAGEQQLFALLSVFAGCTFEAVENVAGEIEPLSGMQPVDVLDRLASLVDKSLVRQRDPGTGEPRLFMLETIREYAAEQLEEDAEFSAAARRAHAKYFAEFAKRQGQRLGADRREAALRELEADNENLQTAWRYWVEQKDLEQLNKFVNGLWFLYDVRGWYHAMVSLTNDLLTVLAATPSTPELAEQEIILQTSLARALLATKGYTEEVEQAYARALKLCESAGDIPQLFPVLRGLASFYILRTEYVKAMELAERMLRLADLLDDSDMRVEGYLALGYNLAFVEDPRQGLEYIDKALALYEPERQRPRRLGLGSNPGVVGLMVSGLLLWMLGYPDQAQDRAARAIALAEKLSHPYTKAYARFHTGLLHIWLGNPAVALEHASELLTLSEEHGFQIWNAVGICLQGAALAYLDDAENGLPLIEQGLAVYQARGMKIPPVFWPLLLHLTAGAYGAVSRPTQGLQLLNKAMEAVQASSKSEKTMKSEFLILTGDLLLALSPHNTPQVEELFRQAVDNAREVEGLMLELRAATRLSRLWQEHGSREQARELLSEAYNRMTEGFGTHDMMAAGRLLAELSNGQPDG